MEFLWDYHYFILILLVSGELSGKPSDIDGDLCECDHPRRRHFGGCCVCECSAFRLMEISEKALEVSI